MACLFCGFDNNKPSCYEDTLFNSKVFEYLKCTNCNLVYVSPLPNETDFGLMYPVTYQGEIYKTATGCYDWLFKQVENFGTNKRILDYGCGNGKFIVEAVAKGYDVTGVEYSKDLVEVLNDQIIQASFLTIPELFDRNDLYDIIFLGNVLEHLTNPVEMLLKLKSRLNKNGLLILEGPIEDNFTVAGAFRRWFFNKRKKSGIKVSHAPRHIFYSGYNNQLAVLTNAGFNKLVYKAHENAWPFSPKISGCRSPKDFVFYLIAKISMFSGFFIPKNGNVFFYIGQPL